MRAGRCRSAAGYGVTTGRPGSPYSIVRRPAEKGPPSPDDQVLGEAGKLGEDVGVGGDRGGGERPPRSAPAAGRGPRSRTARSRRPPPGIRSRCGPRRASASQPNDAASTPSGPPVAASTAASAVAQRPGTQQPGLQQVGVAHHPQPVGAHAAQPVAGAVEGGGQRTCCGVRRGDSGRPAADVDDLRVLVDGHDSPGRSTRSQSRWPGGGGTNRSSSSSTGSGSTRRPARPAGLWRRRPAPSPSARSRRSAP